MGSSVETSRTGADNLPVVSYGSGVLLVLCAGIFWSFIPIGVRSFQTAEVWQILFYRTIGMLPLLIWLIRRQSAGRSRVQTSDQSRVLATDQSDLPGTVQSTIASLRRTGAAGVFGALGLVAAYAGGIASIQMTTIANAAFLFATAPFFAAILARVLLKETIRKATLLALFIAVAGIFIMVKGGVTHFNWLGDFLALISAMGFAVFTIALRAGNTSNSLPVVLLGGIFAIILASVIITVTGRTLMLPVAEILIALFLGFCVLGVGMLLCTIGARIVPAAELALLCMTEVVLAPVWAWLFIGEVPAQNVLLGGGIVIGAIVMNAMTGIRRKPAPVSF